MVKNSHFFCWSVYIHEGCINTHNYACTQICTTGDFNLRLCARKELCDKSRIIRMTIYITLEMKWTCNYYKTHAPKNPKHLSCSLLMQIVRLMANTFKSKVKRKTRRFSWASLACQGGWGKSFLQMSCMCCERDETIRQMWQIMFWNLLCGYTNKLSHNTQDEQNFFYI